MDIASAGKIQRISAWPTLLSAVLSLAGKMRFIASVCIIIRQRTIFSHLPLFESFVRLEGTRPHVRDLKGGPKIYLSAHPWIHFLKQAQTQRYGVLCDTSVSSLTKSVTLNHLTLKCKRWALNRVIIVGMSLYKTESTFDVSLVF